MIEGTVAGLPTDVYLDDVVIGFSYRTRERVITQADINAFAELTGDRTAIHTDPAFAATRPYGRTIAHGAFGLSLMIGLKAELKLYQRSSIAALGWERVKYRLPVFVGDTVHAHVTYVGKKASKSQPTRGVLCERIELLNQNGDRVTEGDHLLMLEVSQPASRMRQSLPP